ncbi:MAG: porin family protein [Prolixibacteraceae bacterium]|nr:porin family protein [Prolixibacteraceae bacterium]
MKKNLLTLCICAILMFSATTSFAQKLSFGEYTGINFSNLHGNLTSNKWEPKSGSSAGFFVEYNLGRLFSVQTEIGYISQYYEMKSYSKYYPPMYFDDVYHGYSNTWYPVYDPNKWDFSFLRFPLLIKYKTPTRLQLGIGGGVFYSVLLNDELTKEERNTVEKENRNIYPPTHDWGYLFSADLSYPVTKEIRFFVTSRLATGQKVFIESLKGKNGSSELGFGLKYTPKNKKESFKEVETNVQDSSKTRCYIKPVVGILLGWNSSSSKPGNYSTNLGSTAGLAFDYRLDNTVSLQTGILFERKGYALSDSSLYYHRFASDSKYKRNSIDTNIDIDYLTIPLNFKFSFGDPVTFYFDFGVYTGFKVNALCHGTTITKYISSSSYSIEKININDAVEGYYKDVDFGYQTGMGVQFPFRKNMKFDLGFVYSGSFSPIIKEPEENTTLYTNDDRSIKNGTISFQFGLQIPITH